MLATLRRHSAWLLPVLAMVLLAPFTPAIDMYCTELAFTPALGDAAAHFSQNPLWQFIYDFGPVPAQIVLVIATTLLAFSFVSTRWLRWRLPALVLVLTMTIGPGLIINATLKDHWGRPRPRQVIEFGGSQEFRPFYKPNFFHQPEPSKGFPSGHTSMGFYFFALYLVGRRHNNRTLATVGIITALFIGGALGVARVAFGGHFFSDVVMSGLITWLVALATDKLVYEYQEKWSSPSLFSSKRRP